jgi:hypothetical protein
VLPFLTFQRESVKNPSAKEQMNFLAKRVCCEASGVRKDFDHMNVKNLLENLWFVKYNQHSTYFERISSS